MLWSHAYGRSMGYLRVLWSGGCKLPYVYLTGSVRFTCGHPWGPCGFHTGMATTVRSVLPEPYGPVWMVCRLGNTRTISGAGPCGVRWGPRVHARIIFTKPNTCDSWPVSARKTTNWPSMGTESLVDHVWKLYMLSLQPRDIQHNSKFFEISCGLECMPCDFPRVYIGLVLTGPVDCPRAACDLGIKYLMLRSHSWDPLVCPSS